MKTGEKGKSEKKILPDTLQKMKKAKPRGCLTDPRGLVWWGIGRDQWHHHANVSVADVPILGPRALAAVL